jgi:hypothetical protein
VTDSGSDSAVLQAVDRKDVRKFFSFRVMKEEPKAKELNFGLLAVFGIFAFMLGVAGGGLLGGIIIAGIVIGCAIAVHNSQANAELENWRGQFDNNQAEFARLARETRRIQSADLTKAILRVFERTQLDRDKLRILDHIYIFEDEQNLLEDDSRERKLGDIVNKSVRMVSQGDYNNKAYRKIRWAETGRIEQFFNPIRLVMLLLTETQLVICDVQIDSMDGDLREEIQRVALAKIVNVRFVAERTRFTMTRDEIVRMAEDLGFEAGEIEDVRRKIGASTATNDDWTQEEVKSVLNVSRTDAGSITVPIRSEIYFGKHRSALDDEGGLTEDEIKVDRMINELNRLVESG